MSDEAQDPNMPAFIKPIDDELRRRGKRLERVPEWDEDGGTGWRVVDHTH